MTAPLAIVRRLFAAGLVAALVVPAAARAAPVNEILAITSSGFTDISGLGVTPPVDPLRLTVGIRFDTSTDIFNQSTGLTVAADSLPVSGLAFSYDSTNDILTLGGAGLGGIGITAGTNDVLLTVDNAFNGTPTFDNALYVSSKDQGIFFSGTGSVAVPEPASLTLLAATSLLALRRRR